MKKRRKKTYYPLKPSKGRYRGQKVVYLNVECTQFSEFVCASALDGNGELWELSTPEQVANFISTLDNNTWIICYDADFIGSVFGALASRFDRVEGYGAEVYVFNIYDGEKKYYLVDIFPFFGKPLEDIAEKIDIRFPTKPTDGDSLRGYCNARLVACGKIWKKYCAAIKRAFGVHPSKSPGATALKMWRTTIKEPVFAKGKTTRRFSKAACMAGAIHWKHGAYSEAYLYDINAAYPHVMRNTKFPVKMAAFIGKPRSDRWIALVKINYKSRVRFSPLSMRDKQTDLVMHPDEAYGVRAILTYIDMETLIKNGDLEVTDWLEGVQWEQEDEQPLFERWAEIVEASSGTPDDKALLKVSSRALHSKFAQNTVSKVARVVRVNSPDDIFEYRDGSIKDVFDLPDGGMAVLHEQRTVSKFRPYWRPEWEALTQAACRAMLYAAIDENTIYCDTDGLISTVPRTDLPMSSVMGDWKLSDSGPCTIIGPRWYTIGATAKAAGVRPTSAEALRSAIPQALTRTMKVEAIEAPSIRQIKKKATTRQHTIRAIKYPHVLAKGSRLFITRSPTVRSPAKYITRFFS